MAGRPIVTPEQIEQLFIELRQATAGTRIKFHLQETSTTIEGIVIDPPGDSPDGLEDGVFLQDIEDFTQIYCLCPEQSNGVGNILVHTFVQAPAQSAKGPSPQYKDEISERLLEADHVTVGGGAIGELYGDVAGMIDTSATPPDTTEPAAD